MRRGGHSVELAILVPIVALLGAGVLDVVAVVSAREALAHAMIDTCVAYEVQDGPADEVLVEAAARRFQQQDGRPARFRAHFQGPNHVRLVGSVRVHPPFGLIGSGLHAGHAVVLDLSGPATAAVTAP